MGLREHNHRIGITGVVYVIPYPKGPRTQIIGF